MQRLVVTCALTMLAVISVPLQAQNLFFDEVDAVGTDSATALCPSGQKVLGGGCQILSATGTLTSADYSFLAPDREGWTCETTGGPGLTVFARAYCIADDPSLALERVSATENGTIVNLSCPAGKESFWGGCTAGAGGQLASSVAFGFSYSCSLSDTETPNPSVTGTITCVDSEISDTLVIGDGSEPSVMAVCPESDELFLGGGCFDPHAQGLRTILPGGTDGPDALFCEWDGEVQPLDDYAAFVYCQQS